MEISTLRKVELSGCFGWMLEKVSLKMRESMGGVIVFQEITWKGVANGSRGTGHGDREKSPSFWRSLRARIGCHTSNIQITEEQSHGLARAINYLSCHLTYSFLLTSSRRGRCPAFDPGPEVNELVFCLMTDFVVLLSNPHLQIIDLGLTQWHYPWLI